MNLFEQFANWKFYLLGAYPNGPLGGLFLNVSLAIVSIIIGLIIGIFFGLGRASCRRYIKCPSVLYIENVRSTPLLMIVFWFYFFLPMLGFHLPLFWSAVIPLSIYAGAYQAEIVRAGFMAVPRGQMDAALSTGMSRWQALFFVVLPQAFKMMVPSFVSFFNSQFKNTAVVYIIGIVELTQAGIIVSQRQPDRMFAAYICMALGFWVVCYTMSHFAQRLERKLGILDYESYKPEICREDLLLIPIPKAVKKVFISHK